MADIITTRSGHHIQGSDAFLVLKEVQRGKVKLPKLDKSPRTKTKKAKKVVEPVTITVATPHATRPTRIIKTAEEPEIKVEVGSWFDELQALETNKKKEESS